MGIKKIFSRHFAIVLILLFATGLKAQIGTPASPTYGNVQASVSSSYYNQLIGLSGTELRSTLQTIVVNETTKGQTYGDIWDILEDADENPLDNTQVWQVYVETGIAKSEHVSGSTGWNREHIFPQTRGGFADGTSFTADGIDVYFSTSSSQIAHAHGDAHHLRASDASENSNRGDLDFSDVSGPRTKNSSFYEPPLSAKGDVARALFYMAVRYNDLSLAAGDQDGQIMGDLTTLLQWHKLDPPDDFEMRRNNVIYEWQNNRNPFIDNPDLVDYIWGDKQGEPWSTNTSILTTSVDVFPVTAYGASSEIHSYTVEGTDLGSVLNISAPAHFEISLTNNPVDFTKSVELATTGGALSSTTVYVRFVPESAIGGETTGYIAHYSDNKSATVAVSGTEGNPLLVSEVVYNQGFETNCAPDWTIYSISSNEDWACDSYGRNGGTAIAMNNYGADTDSEDWLISPEINATGYKSLELNYWMEWDYSGSIVGLYYSSDYTGTGTPTAATWTKLSDVTDQDSWTEYTNSLNSIAATNYYIAFKHTSGNASGTSSRINLDDISILATPIIPVITSNKSSINFGYTSSGSTSSGVSYMVSGEDLEADISVSVEAPFELSFDEASWSTLLTISQGDATDKQVFVRYSPTSEYLNSYKAKITHSSTNATTHIVDILVAGNPNIPIDATGLTRDETLDVVTWNLEWFGAPAKSGSASTWTEQLASVSTTILALDADIYALQEVIVDGVNGDFLAPLVEELNSQAGADTYTGIYGPRYSLDYLAPSTEWPAQRVCYIYRTANFASVQTESMFDALYPDNTVTSIPGYTGNPSSFWSSGRLPFLLQADVTVNGTTVPLNFINIHAKCCSDSKDRRVADALFLKDELDANFDTQNVIVLGDYNDYETGSISGGESPYITWWENANEDYLRAIGASIDHISISNELYFEYQSLSNNTNVGSTTISDHNPVMLRLKLDDINSMGQIIELDEIANKEFGSEPFTVNAQSSENLPVSYEIVSGPATITGNVVTLIGVGTVIVNAFNNGDDVTMAASDQKSFVVTKGTQTITFNLASEVNLSDGSIALAATSSVGLPISFAVSSGSGTISGNTLSFTQAGDITVEASNSGNDNYNAASVSKTITVVDGTNTAVGEISKLDFVVYPNPSDGKIAIKGNFNNKSAVAKIYSSTGNLIDSFPIEGTKNVDLSHFKSGVYLLKIEADNFSESKTIIIK